MNVIRNDNPRPISVAVAAGVLAAALLLRLFMWYLAVNWKAVATYTSFLYLGPFSFFLIWAIYRGKNWGRLLFAVLYIPHLLSWTRAMVVRDYSAYDIAFMGFHLLLQAGAILLLLVPSSNVWFRAGVISVNPQGGANGEQPSRSEDIHEVSRSAPRRSP